MVPVFWDVADYKVMSSAFEFSLNFIELHVRKESHGCVFEGKESNVEKSLVIIFIFKAELAIVICFFSPVLAILCAEDSIVSDLESAWLVIEDSFFGFLSSNCLSDMLLKGFLAVEVENTDSISDFCAMNFVK